MLPDIIQLKISLKNTKPAVWREIQISENASLQSLYYAINDAMGWKNSHLWMFRIDGEEYGDPDCDLECDGWNDASKYKVGKIAKKNRHFEYVYDFGDNWIHDVTVEDVLLGDAKEKYPLCIGGENACPPEDCGGPSGYADFKEAITNRKHKNHKEMIAWYAETNFDRSFNPKDFDLEFVNSFLMGRRQKLRTGSK